MSGSITATKRSCIKTCGYKTLKIIRLPRFEDGSFGFQTDWDKRKGIFVSSIIPKGAADMSGRLKIGDQLLWIENENIEHATYDEVLEKLDNAPVVVRLVVSQTLNYHRLSKVPSEFSEVQLIPNLTSSEEPYTFEVHYLVTT